MTDTPFPVRLPDGETLLWSGRPGQGLLLSRSNLAASAACLLAAMAIVRWPQLMPGHHNGGAAGAAAWWARSLVVALLLYLAAGRFVVDAWLRRDMHYALTDRRILIARGGLLPKLTSVDLAAVADLALREHPGGTGTIRFKLAAPPRPGRSYPAWHPALDPTPQFLAIDAAADVRDRMERARRAIA